MESSPHDAHMTYTGDLPESLLHCISKLPHALITLLIHHHQIMNANEAVFKDNYLRHRLYKGVRF